MQSALQLTFRHLPHSEALAMQIRWRAGQLEEIYAGIISCHVVVEPAGHTHGVEQRLHISINLGLPGHEVIVNRAVREGGAPEPASSSVNRAFDEAKRELETWMSKHQSERRARAHERL